MLTYKVQWALMNKDGDTCSIIKLSYHILYGMWLYMDFNFIVLWLLTELMVKLKSAN